MAKHDNVSFVEKLLNTLSGDLFHNTSVQKVNSTAHTKGDCTHKVTRSDLHRANSCWGVHKATRQKAFNVQAHVTSDTLTMVQGFRITHSVALDKEALLTNLLKLAANLRTATCHKNWLNSECFQQDDIMHDLLSHAGFEHLTRNMNDDRGLEVNRDIRRHRSENLVPCEALIFSSIGLANIGKNLKVIRLEELGTLIEA
mmetsp:Transcript_15772/g.30491  ORF Transcript_15772/g.30491 Transcript_15772/m.30491 type:complete len:200 (+) Transcript_15772:1200-1799(+)